MTLLLPAPTLRNDIYSMDVLDFVRTLPDESVNLIVTSPPYFGQRDYGTAKWQGGNPFCQHRVGNQIQDNKAPGAITAGVRPGVDATTCKVCGAKRVDNQIGLERSMYDYIARMVAIFRECRRVLTKDGSLYLNIGDSYNSYKANTGGSKFAGENGHNSRESGHGLEDRSLPPKCLMMIPARMAIAMVDDGWVLREDIIWAKPNPRPESHNDRCTKSHEYLYHFSKQPKHYSNMDAVRESVVSVDKPSGKKPSSDKQSGVNHRIYTGFNERWNNRKEPLTTRNKRDVWTISPEPSSVPHYAMMPTKLVEPCILMSSRPGDVVLDPFMGAGTVALVARRLGRTYLGCDLNPAYVAIANERLALPDKPKKVRKAKPAPKAKEPVRVRIGELVFQQTTLI